jgi:hypothetical protein
VSSVIVAGRYELGVMLGRSASGTTHRAIDLRSGASCVVKRSPLEDAGERARLTALIEAERPRLLALRHPHLARILDCQVLAKGTQAELLVVQQYVDGKNLDQLHAAGQHLGKAEVLAVGLAAARALQAIHDEGLVHGEVRPSNLVRAPLGKLFLVDLGGLGHKLASAPNSARGWDPPEGTAKPTPASDVYALGATLAFLLTRRDPASLIGADGRIDFRRGARVNNAFAEVLDRMLDPEPDRRFPRGRELATTMARLEPSMASGGRWWVTGAVAAAVVLVAAAGSALRHARPRRVAAAPASFAPPTAPSPPPAASPPLPAPPGTAKMKTVTANEVVVASSLEALAAALAAGAMRDETTLTISGAGVWAGSAATDAWRALLASPDLAGIEELKIATRVTRGALAELLAGGTLGSLRALTFAGTGIGVDGVAALAASPLAGQLQALDLIDEELGEAAAYTLAHSTRLAGVRQLGLSGNRLGDGGASELARSKVLRSVEKLDLGANGLGNAAAPALAMALDAGGLPALRLLSLVDNDLGSGAPQVLAAVRRHFEYLIRAGEPRSAGVTVTADPLVVPPARPSDPSTPTPSATRPPG